jgi:hypothetical protein
MVIFFGAFGVIASGLLVAFTLTLLSKLSYSFNNKNVQLSRLTISILAPGFFASIVCRDGPESIWGLTLHVLLLPFIVLALPHQIAKNRLDERIHQAI